MTDEEALHIFDTVNPHAKTRPEHCPVCLKQGSFYGRLNFARGIRYLFDKQYCPMHKLALAKGRLTKEQVRLIPA